MKFFYKLKKHIVKLLLISICTQCLFTGCGEKNVEGIVTASENVAAGQAITVSADLAEGADNSDALQQVNEFNEEEEALYTYICSLYTENEAYFEALAEPSYPYAMAGQVFEGYARDIFFANGTPITIVGPKADVSEYNHDIELQDALGNGLNDENKGYGAIVLWEEEGETNYVYVSNMAQIFGGCYRANLKGDTSIYFDGSVKSSADACVSFVFGGGLNGDVYGSTLVSVNSAQPMYTYGGCLNGSVYGDTNINYSGDCWSFDVCGGSLAYANDSDEAAMVFGNVNMNIECKKMADVNVILGGTAAAVSGNGAAADVIGNVSLNAAGFVNEKLVLDGAVSGDENGFSAADIYGEISLNGEVLLPDKISVSYNSVSFNEAEIFSPDIYKITLLEPRGFDLNRAAHTEGSHAAFICDYQGENPGVIVYIYNTEEDTYKYRIPEINIPVKDENINVYATKLYLTEYIEKLKSAELNGYTEFKKLHYNPNILNSLIFAD